MKDNDGQPKHTLITRYIATKILSGEYPCGHRLPMEAALIEKFGASRTALREGFRTLSAKGLVVSRKRLGTLVAERDRWNLLDPDVLEWMENTEIQAEFLSQVSEARLIFEPEAARHAARRANAAQVAEVEKAFLSMKLAKTDSDRIDADLAFHTAILAASQNYVLQRLTGIIGTALRSTFAISDQAAASYEATLDLHGAVLSAIRRQDEDQAHKKMQELLGKSISDLGLKKFGD